MDTKQSKHGLIQDYQTLLIEQAAVFTLLNLLIGKLTVYDMIGDKPFNKLTHIYFNAKMKFHIIASFKT